MEAETKSIDTNHSHLKYFIALTLLEGIGSVTAKKLIAYCGSAEAVFCQKKGALLRIPGIGQKLASRIFAHKEVLKRAEKEIAFMEKNRVQPLLYLDERYPRRLKHCDDGPLVLYCKGKMDMNSLKAVGIVGTRNAGEYGKEVCARLVEELVPHGALVVSGLAYGIDICAHRAALTAGLQTVAVLGHGLDRIYPSLHKPVAEKMQENGGLVSDFVSNTLPDRENFPSRNRIIAGLSDAILVIETGKRGGSLITAEIAHSYHRDIFAVPGRLKDTRSEGCNWLIKTNKAALLESVKDLEYIMGWELSDHKTKPKQMRLFTDLAPEEQALVDILTNNGATRIDALCLKAGMNSSQIASILLNLEFNGVVRCLPGKIYQLN